MTVDSESPTAPIALDPGASLKGVEPAYRSVVRIQLTATWVPLAIAAIVLDALLLTETAVRWLPTVAAILLGVLAVVIVPARKYRRIGYALSARTIRVVRGYLFHIDTVVPFIRVQHIDVARGPLERMFGVASLVVHTAGTHNSIVTLPGLAPATAEAIRDTIRSHIRSDFE